MRPDTRIPLQINEQGQVTDDTVLKRDRWKFGLGMIISQSEEVGLGGLPTVIIRRMGGNDFHLGLFGALSGLNSLFQLLGPFILQWKKSNRKAMQWTMKAGTAITVLAAFSILGLYLSIPLPLLLAGFILFSGLLGIMQGVQWNLESCWVGDLVPVHRLGWFTSLKWILATLGIVASTQAIARVGDAFPGPGGYAGIYLFFGVSYVIAFTLYGRVTDRPPREVSLPGFSSATAKKVAYRHPVLIYYIAFYTLWNCGRILANTFFPAFLIDQFQFRLTDMAWLMTLQFLLSCVSIGIMGKITDRIGHRAPLIFVIAVVGAFQSGYVLSAWWGLAPIIVFTVINAMAGHGFSMLAINYGLEIFPAHARSVYLAVTRFVIGIFVTLLLVFSGKILEGVRGLHVHFLGADLGHYHLLFAIAVAIILLSLVPLGLIGRRRIEG